VKEKSFWRLLGIVAVLLLAFSVASCAPKVVKEIVIVEKEVEKEVTKIVKETVVVERVIEKIVEPPVSLAKAILARETQRAAVAATAVMVERKTEIAAAQTLLAEASGTPSSLADTPSPKTLVDTPTPPSASPTKVSVRFKFRVEGAPLEDLVDCVTIGFFLDDECLARLPIEDLVCSEGASLTGQVFLFITHLEIRGSLNGRCPWDDYNLTSGDADRYPLPEIGGEVILTFVKKQDEPGKRSTPTIGKVRPTNTPPHW